MKTSRVDNTVPLEQIQQLLLVLFLLLDQASKSPARSGPRLTVIMRLTTIAPVALATSGPISEDLEAMGAAMAASNDQNVSSTHVRRAHVKIGCPFGSVGIWILAAVCSTLSLQIILIMFLLSPTLHNKCAFSLG